MRKTKEEAQETRNLILDTAEAIFSEKGVSRTTLNDIANAAELTRGAIYWHFKNKADLFDAMLQRVILPMDEFVATPDLHPEQQPLAYLRTRSMHVVRTLAEDPRTQRVFDIVMHKTEMVDDMLPIRDMHLESIQDCLQTIEVAFRAAIDKGELSANINARQAAIGLHSLIDGLFANYVLSPELFDLMTQAEFTIDNYLHGLANRK
ncbi:TetR family transcriptional regulator [Limnobacter sp.]|uniref:TetR family transcriptional regulator n=1 Tax=Limnobacter sp. TaxID=2003368 RepID=UPI002FDF5FCB